MNFTVNKQDLTFIFTYEEKGVYGPEYEVSVVIDGLKYSALLFEGVMKDSRRHIRLYPFEEYEDGCITLDISDIDSVKAFAADIHLIYCDHPFANVRFIRIIYGKPYLFGRLKLEWKPRDCLTMERELHAAKESIAVIQRRLDTLEAADIRKERAPHKKPRDDPYDEFECTIS